MTALTAYVLKMYPRFSETFIVSEILAREAAGERFMIISLRPPTDARFHPELARVQSPVVYVDRASSPRRLWATLRAAGEHPSLERGIAKQLPELLRAEASDAEQAVALARLVHEHGITHLHAHFGSMATTVARLAGLITGTPYSFTAHAKDIFHESVVHEDLLRKIMDAHHVVTISNFNLRHLAREFGADAASRLTLIYNGLELSRFPFREPAPITDPVRLLSVGRLVEKKGFPLLIDAVHRLRERGVNVRCTIIGDGALAADLQQQIDSLGLTDHVRLTGPRTQAEIISAFRDHDLFVAPFVVGADGNADGLPTVLLEAMASGLPVIASDVTAVPEVVIDHRTGILVRTGDREDLVRGIERALSPTTDRVGLAQRARALIEEQFDSARQASALASAQKGEVR